MEPPFLDINNRVSDKVIWERVGVLVPDLHIDIRMIWEVQVEREAGSELRIKSVTLHLTITLFVICASLALSDPEEGIRGAVDVFSCEVVCV